MFTGIVEEMGRVDFNEGGVLRVETSLGGLKAGDSVAVNGACLTVTHLRGSKARRHALEFEMSLETLSRTCLGLLREDDPANLERPLTLERFVGGHLTTGHVDSTALILAKTRLHDGSTLLRVELPRHLRRFVPIKGSVAVDGVSLTVTRVGRYYLETVLIPHTLSHTTLGAKDEKSLVNFEVDLMARYLDSLLER